MAEQELVYEYSVPIELRFADLDAYGHVNSAVYFTFLETARTKLFQQQFIALMNQELLFLVAKAECEYKRPITLQDTLIVALNVARIGNSSFDIDYRLHDGKGTLFALAETVMVCYDGKAQKPTRIPEQFKQLVLADKSS